MHLLLFVSFIWAFSFGLIKGRLAGLDSTAVAVLRLALALVVFLPFLRPQAVTLRTGARLAILGAVQFGLMYVLYLRAFQFLQSYEVALFTIFTPLYVTLLDAALEVRWQRRHSLASVLSVFGAAIILWESTVSRHLMIGFLLMQLSNLCFAAGQIAWRKERGKMAGVKDAQIFAWPLAGALVVAAVVSLFTTDWLAVRPTQPQILTLLYLGVLASGFCFFWWNQGAAMVDAGTLAVFNNAKIPLAVACSLWFFGETANLTRLLVGGGVIAAALTVVRRPPGPGARNAP